MSKHTEDQQLLNSAEKLFYERGFQAVGMDALRKDSGLPLKKIYALYNGKQSIALAMLERRDIQWRQSLQSYLDTVSEPRERIDAIFDWLHKWLKTEGHRGCAWINAFGELGGHSPEITKAVRDHKERFREIIEITTAELGVDEETTEALFLLAEGSLVTAGITGDPSHALTAQKAARTLIPR